MLRALRVVDMGAVMTLSERVINSLEFAYAISATPVNQWGPTTTNCNETVPKLTVDNIVAESSVMIEMQVKIDNTVT